MAFFPRSFYGSPETASFQPLFRLLSDFDSFSRESAPHHGHRNHVPSFQPKFDVREVADAYELHGELSGMKKEDVQIQFTDPHTLLIRGRVERSYASGSNNNTSSSEAVTDSKMSGAITEGTEEPATTPAPAAAAEEDAASATSSNGHQATVEEDFEDVAEEAAGSTRASTPTVDATPATTVAEVAKEKPVAAPTKQQPARAKRDSARYWVSERSIGEFSRSFHFPGQIVQDAVTAGLQDGVLSIRVPKAPKHEARTIFIN